MAKSLEDNLDLLLDSWSQERTETPRRQDLQAAGEPFHETIERGFAGLELHKQIHIALRIRRFPAEGSESAESPHNEAACRRLVLPQQIDQSALAIDVLPALRWVHRVGEEPNPEATDSSFLGCPKKEGAFALGKGSRSGRVRRRAFPRHIEIGKLAARSIRRKAIVSAQLET